MSSLARIAILFEHPDWFQPLFAELRRRGIVFAQWNAASLAWDGTRPNGIDLVFNRMSPSAYWRGHGCGQFTTLWYLRHLEESGVEVVNGSRAYEYEISKARQMDLFRKCAVPFPRTSIVNSAEQLLRVAEGMRLPILLKPACGGAGSGIRRFDSLADLPNAALPDCGVDATMLVQEYKPPRGGVITRVEVLGGEVLYAMEVQATGFNLCPADACQPGSRRMVEPSREIVEMALALARQASIDTGGFECLTDDRTGQLLFYDVNVLSNYASNAEDLLGFSPTSRQVDYLLRRLAAVR